MRAREGARPYCQERDPDGDGDAHLLVVADRHLVNLKFRRAAGVLRLPDVGARILAVGIIRDGRFRIPELEVAPHG